MPYQAVLFDLDGTLIDSLDDLAQATNRTLAQHGFPIHPTDAYKLFVGDGVRNLILRALPEAARSDQALVDRCLHTYAADYGTNWNAHTRLYPGIADMLDALVTRGIHLTLLSNKPHVFTQACASEFLAKWHFDIVMGAQASFPHKPDPSAALDIAHRLNIAPASFLYLGDTSTDMQTACNAGMFPVGVTWGFRSREELESSGARRIITHPLELPYILDPQS